MMLAAGAGMGGLPNNDGKKYADGGGKDMGRKSSFL